MNHIRHISSYKYLLFALSITAMTACSGKNPPDEKALRESISAQLFIPQNNYDTILVRAIAIRTYESSLPADADTIHFIDYTDENKKLVKKFSERFDKPYLLADGSEKLPPYLNTGYVTGESPEKTLPSLAAITIYGEWSGPDTMRISEVFISSKGLSYIYQRFIYQNGTWRSKIGSCKFRAASECPGVFRK